MRIVCAAVIVQLTACSFTMGKPPSTVYVEDEQPCSESYSATGFDGTMAASAAVFTLLALLSYKDHGCVDNTAGLFGTPSCSFYDWNIGLGAAATVGFTLAAYKGQGYAGACRELHDQHDEWVATQLSPEQAKERNVCLVARAKAVAQATNAEEAERAIANMPCGGTPEEQARLRNTCLIERHKIAAQITDPLEAEHLIASMPCGETPPVAHKSTRRRSEYGGVSGGLVGALTGFVLGAIASQRRY
ncbi:MAG: hypothetical protein JWO36_6800 [Myxococcales bacterium]|nr:hypothetical protein [Myxococcales bacterium]